MKLFGLLLLWPPFAGSAAGVDQQFAVAGGQVCGTSTAAAQGYVAGASRGQVSA